MRQQGYGRQEKQDHGDCVFVEATAVNASSASEYLRPPPPPPPPMAIQAAEYNEGLKVTPVRFFICDDSGSMMTADGHRLVGEGTNARLIECSRWLEMTETLRFHVGLASAANAPTEFRLLNGASPLLVGQSALTDQVNVPILQALFDESSPNGGTPLCYQVGKVIQQITAISSQLRDAGKKAAVIILTDGEASDGNIAAAMRPLVDLPVWVVIRLCTDDDKMVQYWNSVDGEIELNMDVIDDPLGEASEIHAFNSWLTYGEPLHRLREFGCTAKEMDLIDEAALTMEQMRSVCAFIFNCKSKDLPEPAANWSIFESHVSSLNDQVPMVWNPITKKMSKWIDMHALKRQYGRRGKNECGCIVF